MSQRAANRILFFDAYPHMFGGAQRATLLLAGGLARGGWRVTLATPALGPYVDAARAAGHDTLVLPVPPSLRIYGRQTRGRRAAAAVAALPVLWVRLASCLREQADVVHVADHRGQLLIGPAARLAGVPVVWHIHAMDRNPVLCRFGSAFAARILVPSRTMADSMRGLRLRDTIIVPYALAAGSFLDGKVASDVPTVLTVGRLHPDKGLDVLLRALARVRERRPALRARIVGARQMGFEDHEQQLLALRSRLGLDECVTLLGAVADPLPLLRQADVYVQSSRERTELQPIAVLEAMAAGVPVVATAVGGVPEMLGEGARGKLVPPEDPIRLAQAILDVLDDPRASRTRAVETQRWARERCSASRMVEQVEEVYRSL